MAECAEFSDEQRIKSAHIEANVISIFERVPLSTSLPIVCRIPGQPNNNKQSKRYKQLNRKFSTQFNLFPPEASLVYNFRAFKRTISKMKDIVNGNTLIDNGKLISKQNHVYTNGVTNEDR